jgi:hypothetical protein
MRNRRRTFGLLALLIVLAAAIAWYRSTPGETPAGQPPLVTLHSESLRRLRDDFNRDASQSRVIVLLSPT